MDLSLLLLILAFSACLLLLVRKRLHARARAFTKAVVGTSPLPKPKRRLLILNGLLEPVCEVCVHFDYEMGQASFAQHEAFMGAAKHLTPEQMGVAGAAGRGEHDWDITGPKLPSDRAVTRWEDYGACQLHREGVHKASSCREYA